MKNALILAGSDTGAANAFTITNNLTGATVSFSGNAVEALDASLTINNVPVSSASNTLTSAIEGVTLTLITADNKATTVVEVARDDGSLSDRLKTFVTAYNDLAELTTVAPSATNPIGRDSLLRGVRTELRAALTGAYGSGAYTRLAEVGVGFSRTGQLTLDEAQLAESLQTDPDAVASLFADATTGAFASITTLVKNYTQADGLVPDARTRLTDQITRLGTRIGEMEARLAIRRTALSREFAAADQAMSRLNSQLNAIAGFGARLSTSGL